MGQNSTVFVLDISHLAIESAHGLFHLWKSPFIGVKRNKEQIGDRLKFKVNPSDELLVAYKKTIFSQIGSFIDARGFLLSPDDFHGFEESSFSEFLYQLCNTLFV